MSGGSSIPPDSSAGDSGGFEEGDVKRFLDELGAMERDALAEWANADRDADLRSIENRVENIVRAELGPANDRKAHSPHPGVSNQSLARRPWLWVAGLAAAGILAIFVFRTDSIPEAEPGTRLNGNGTTDGVAFSPSGSVPRAAIRVFDWPGPDDESYRVRIEHTDGTEIANLEVFGSSYRPTTEQLERLSGGARWKAERIGADGSLEPTPWIKITIE